MDPFKLLSRSTKLSRDSKVKQHQPTPSSDPNSLPQLFADQDSPPQQAITTSRKRKRSGNALARSNGGLATFESSKLVSGTQSTDATLSASRTQNREDQEDGNESVSYARDKELSLEERKKLLRQHKLKFSWLNPPVTSNKARRETKDTNGKARKGRCPLFPEPLQSFDGLAPRHGISKRLASNVADQGFKIPTEVQLGSLPLLLNGASAYTSSGEQYTYHRFGDRIDLLTVAPTGSGKTLAFMIPLVHRLQHRKRIEHDEERHTSAIILAPTKELARQIVNEGRKLVKNTGITISRMRKGSWIDAVESRKEGETAVNHQDFPNVGSVVKSDIIVSTPGVLQNELKNSDRGFNSLDGVRDLILDEGDVLLDPLFRDQTLEIWKSLRNPVLRVSMWSATMGSNIEELAVDTIAKRRERLVADNPDMSPKVPLIRLVVGLKDSAVPNVEHKLVYAATEQGKLMGLRQLLHPSTSSAESGPPLRPPFLIFTQTIERAIALHAELLYDVPAEAGGISRIAVLHADLSDTVRDSVMTRFRTGEIWILITTDLLSRGVDFRGVNGVVNYDITTSSAAYVHRIGRTGRAGRVGGVAVTLYSKEDIPYLKHVVNIVSMAQRQKGDEDGVQQWLLDAIPDLGKNKKQNLKKHGVESRTARGKEKDPKSAKKTRISSKAGYVRRAENKRKGAISGSQKRAHAGPTLAEDNDSDFGGFD